MNPRQRFIECVTHGHPDRAVFDLCGCPQTVVEKWETKQEIGRLLGVEGEKQGSFHLDERILQKLRVDIRSVGGMPTPHTRFAREENGVIYDSWGIGYKRIRGHLEMCYHPLQDCNIDQMMEYPFPNPDEIDGSLIRQWAETARHLHEHTDFAIVAEHPVLGVLELGCWMFGFDDFLYRLAGEPEVAHAFFNRVLEYQKKVIDIYYGALGKYIDCTTSGDDFGTQIGPFMSLSMFEKLVKPYLKERISYTRRHTDAFYQHHTCGSVYTLIPSLIDCGVDILNPIQPGAYMMECDRLKKEFGGKIAFWGGIDTQHLLPNGTPEEIRREVARVLSIMEAGGGYILAPAHTIQEDVPAENVIAIYEGAAEYYGFR